MPINDLSRIPAEWPNRLMSESLQVSNLQWHFQISRHPDPDAPSIVLLHGTGASAHSWTHYLPVLAQNYTVIVPDLPGHGFTVGAKKTDLHIDAIAKSLHSLLHALGFTKVTAIIGHSAGANCALALSLLFKHSPLAVIGLNPSFVAPPQLYNFFVGPMINPMVTSSLLAHFLANTIPLTGMVDKLLSSTNSLLTEEQRRPYRTLFKDHNHIYGSINFMAASNIPELLEKSTQLQTQYTFLVAAQDPWVPQSSLLPILKKYFLRATLHIEEGGHLFHEENTARTLEVIYLAMQAVSSRAPSNCA